MKELKTEQKLVRSLVSSRMLTKWRSEFTAVPDRWKEVFQLDTGKVLQILPRLIQLIFSAIPLGVSQKMADIFEDVPHIWKCEMFRTIQHSRDRNLSDSWLMVKIGLILRHNIAYQTNTLDLIFHPKATPSEEDEDDESDLQMFPKSKETPKIRVMSKST